MPEMIGCPKCGFKVQMAEGLLGQRVRCLSCAELFVADPVAPPVPVAHRADTPSAALPAPVDSVPLPPCPGCGRGVAWEQRVCPFCREELEPDGRGRRPERRPGPRRDVELHRGSLIAGLGKASLILGGLALCTGGCAALLSVPLGLVAWILAANDLEGMKNGTIDPGGRAQTEDGRAQAILGIVLSVLFALGFATWFLVTH